MESEDVVWQGEFLKLTTVKREKTEIGVSYVYVLLVAVEHNDLISKSPTSALPLGSLIQDSVVHWEVDSVAVAGLRDRQFETGRHQQKEDAARGDHHVVFCSRNENEGETARKPRISLTR